MLLAKTTSNRCPPSAVVGHPHFPSEQCQLKRARPSLVEPPTSRIKIFHHDGSLYYKKMFDKLYQADWKPESADSFCEITELVKSVSSLKIQGTKSEGQGSKASQHPTLVPSQKPAAYRPPHAKNAAAVQLFGGAILAQVMSKAALRNKKKREKQREKKAVVGSSAGDAS
ncbi:hypothetical protein Droror1_Dr00018339 [Drosera rotundifolia]